MSSRKFSKQSTKNRLKEPNTPMLFSYDDLSTSTISISRTAKSQMLIRYDDLTPNNDNVINQANDVRNYESDNQNDISLDELTADDWLSVRTVNVCMAYGLTSLHKILKYYWHHNSFKGLKNCGEKSDKQLIKLCLTFEEYYKVESLEKNDATLAIETTISYPVIEQKPILEIINTLTPFQKSILNRHFEYLLANLNLRTRNGLREISLNLKPKDILESIFGELFSFKAIRNIGNKSTAELEKFKIDLTKFIEILLTIDKDKLNKEYAKLIIKSTFPTLHDSFRDKFESVFDNNGKIKLFALLNLLAESGQLFPEIKKKIFFQSFANEKGQPLDLKKIGLELKITRERVRQIKVEIEGNIENNLSFLSNLVLDDLVSYGVDSTKNYQVIDSLYTNQINKNENVNFNTKFYIKVFGILLKRTHHIIGDNDEFSGRKLSVNLRKHGRFYLIHTLLFDCFDFEKFIEDIYSKINEKYNEEYALHFEGYLSEFLKEDGKYYLDEIRPTCEAMIFIEFDLIVASNGYLVFERNTRKQIHEYCYEILDENSEPMTLDQIEKAINRKYPEINKTADSIRGSLIREKKLFVSFGRTSIYALRKWEQEKIDLKGGTIRDIVENYLVNEDRPKHISDIAKYVSKYRNTNVKNVLSNIKIDKSNRFVFFKNGFVGIVSKDYSGDFSTFKPKFRKWEDVFQELKKFRELNSDKWPKVNSTDKNERYLYYFVYKARIAFQKNKLNKQREDLLRSINFPLDEIVTREKDWKTQVRKLIGFLNSEQKWPSASSNNKEEKALYRFCYMNKKAFHNKELSDEKIEILRKINFNFNLLR